MTLMNGDDADYHHQHDHHDDDIDFGGDDYDTPFNDANEDVDYDDAL